jgi:class 3 adenylate cyclase/tetratricopeptide (TPR) repeat protein
MTNRDAPSAPTFDTTTDKERDKVSLPAPLAELLASRFSREGERKQVTVLFADIRGSTTLIEAMDPEQALHRLEPVIEEMIRAVQRYGGTVCRTQGDGILALFGAPQAYEDHAVRACYAAWALQEAVSGLGEAAVQTRVGLNSGEVVVRSLGHELSLEYDVVGSAAHLASRIEQLAHPGTAWMSATTARLARGFIQVNAKGWCDIKGLSSPVELFELAGTQGQTRWQARVSVSNLVAFVGRDAETRMLADALDRAKGGRGQIVAIVGEAGMGKSRLVHEFLQAQNPASSLSAGAMPHDSNASYRLIAGMLRTWLSVGDHDSQAAIDEKLIQVLSALGPRSALDIAPFRFLLDLPVDGAGWVELDAAQRRIRIREAVLSLVFRLAETEPFIMVVEDLHWADAESRTVIDAIADQLGLSRILLMATYRPEHRPDWVHYQHFSLVQLRPFDNATAEALLRSLLGTTEELGPLRERVIKQGEGTPLFLEEMARALVETGVLVPNTFTNYQLTRDLEDVEVPQSVRSVIASRIDRLPNAERVLLQIASVIGKEVPLALLRSVAGIQADALERQLDELRSQEFLYLLRRPAGQEYSFRHALIHTAAYDSMLMRHRRALHGKVLEAIEVQFAQRIDEFTERLADHAVRGEIWDKAVLYCRKAGDRANARSAHKSAAVFLRQALDALNRLSVDTSTIQQAIDIRLGLRVALAAAGEFPSILAYLEEAESLAHSIGDERRLMAIAISRSTILSNLGDLDEALQAGLHGRALALRQEDDLAIVSSGFALGQAHWNRGEFDKAAAILAQTITFAAAGASKAGSGTTGNTFLMCLVSLSHTHAFTGKLAAAREHSSEAIRIATQTSRPYDLSYAHAAHGLVHLTLGEEDEAAQCLAEALRIAEASDIGLLIPHAVRYLGRAYTHAGRSAEAVRLLAGAMEQARRQSLRGLQGWCAASLALAQQAEGDLAEAERSAMQAVELARTHGYAPLEVHADRVTASIIAGRGEDSGFSRARLLLISAAERAERMNMQPELALCRHQLADLLARSDRLDEAVSAVAAAISAFGDIGMRRHERDATQLHAALKSRLDRSEQVVHN